MTTRGYEILSSSLQDDISRASASTLSLCSSSKIFMLIGSSFENSIVFFKATDL